MKMTLKGMSTSLFATVMLLILLEILNTAFIPAIGIHKYHLAFNILIILFLGFKVESPYLPVFILVIQFFHSAFSVDSWAYGTFAGVLVCVGISYVKEILDFSSALSTIIVTQIFQVLWFIIVSLLIYLKTQNFHMVSERFWHFIPESLVLSVLSPFFFQLLSKIWRVDSVENFGAQA